MNGKMIVDKVEVKIEDNKRKPVAMKGRIVKNNNFDEQFLSHRFDTPTLRTMFWAQFELDYIGG